MGNAIYKETDLLDFEFKFGKIKKKSLNLSQDKGYACDCLYMISMTFVPLILWGLLVQK